MSDPRHAHAHAWGFYATLPPLRLKLGASMPVDESLWSRARFPPPQASHSGVEAGAVDPVGCEEHVEELALSLEQGGHGELHRSPPFDAVVVRLGLLPAAEDAVEGPAGFRI